MVHLDDLASRFIVTVFNKSKTKTFVCVRVREFRVEMCGKLQFAPFYDTFTLIRTILLHIYYSNPLKSTQTPILLHICTILLHTRQIYYTFTLIHTSLLLKPTQIHSNPLKPHFTTHLHHFTTHKANLLHIYANSPNLCGKLVNV